MLIAKLCRCPVRQHASVVHHQDAIAQRGSLVHVVRAEQHRHLALRAQHLEHGLHLFFRAGVEPCRWLVHQQERRSSQEAPRDRNLLLLSPRQLFHRLVERVQRQAQPLENSRDLLARTRRSAAVQARRVQHVFPRAQLFEERRFDRHAVYKPPHLSGIRHHVQAEHLRGPRVGREQGREDADERRLSASVGPEDAGHTAGLNRQEELVQGDLVLGRRSPPRRARFALAAPERLSDSLDLNRWNAHH